MKYTLYWIVIMLGIILISILMEGKPEMNVLTACFIWGILASIFFDLVVKNKGEKK